MYLDSGLAGAHGFFKLRARAFFVGSWVSLAIGEEKGVCLLEPLLWTRTWWGKELTEVGQDPSLGCGTREDTIRDALICRVLQICLSASRPKVEADKIVPVLLVLSLKDSESRNPKRVVKESGGGEASVKRALPVRPNVGIGVMWQDINDIDGSKKDIPLREFFGLIEVAKEQKCFVAMRGNKLSKLGDQSCKDLLFLLRSKIKGNNAPGERLHCKGSSNSVAGHEIVAGNRGCAKVGRKENGHTSRGVGLS